MKKARAIYDNTIMTERREKIYSEEEYMDRMEIGLCEIENPKKCIRGRVYEESESSI